jgi:hypothetical protein
MKLNKFWASIALFGIAAMANASDGVFDRTAEVDKYVELMKSGDRGQLVLVSREIYGSGISDARLANSIYERLYRDRKQLDGTRVDTQYGVFMVKALASTGLASTKEQLKAVRSGMTNNKVNSASASEVKLVDWHLKRDTVMASTANHHEGDDPNVSRLINLIKTGDSSFQHWAVERMNWDKVLDDRLMQVIAVEVQAYVDRGGGKLSSEADDTMASFVKLLGYSKNVKYRPLLISVSKLQNISPGVKRHAKYAMDKLY